MAPGPTRLQFQRRKGFDLQRLSQDYNGREAILITRSTVWGNPFAVHPEQKVGRVWHGVGGDIISMPTVADALACYREMLTIAIDGPEPETGTRAAELRAHLHELRGKNLACYCRAGEPCHGDILLEFANRPVCEEVK